MLLPLLLLAGCGGTEEQTQKALDLRTELLAAGGCAFDAEVQISYGDTASRFSARCVYSQTDGVTMTLTAPQTLSGMTARVDGSGAKLVFDGAEIGFSTLAGGRVAPMAAPWLLADCWARGYIAYSGMEDGQLRVTYQTGYGRDALDVDVWLNDDGLPARAEISYDGALLLAAELSNFTFEA